MKHSAPFDLWVTPAQKTQRTSSAQGVIDHKFFPGALCE